MPDARQRQLRQLRVTALLREFLEAFVERLRQFLLPARGELDLGDVHGYVTEVKDPTQLRPAVVVFQPVVGRVDDQPPQFLRVTGQKGPHFHLANLHGQDQVVSLGFSRP